MMENAGRSAKDSLDAVEKVGAEVWLEEQGIIKHDLSTKISDIRRTLKNIRVGAVTDDLSYDDLQKFSDVVLCIRKEIDAISEHMSK